MKEIIGDDHPTYEDSVKLTLAEREVHKDNLERLLLENVQLKHRLSCIKDDIEIIDRHISAYKKSRKIFEKPSRCNNGCKKYEDNAVYADEAIHNLTNIEIACDLSDESVDEWGSDLAEEYRQQHIKHMEAEADFLNKYKAKK
tara:strand:- start:1107 stop:1535 length:429 start_codon:yes stop_codon:yes gene_type:complete